MASLNPSKTIYPFAEMFVVTTNGTTAVDVFEIPKQTAITMVLCEVVTASTGGAQTVYVGDASDPNGFIVGGTLCGATVGTVFGDRVSERGAYLNDTTGGTAIDTHGGQWKLYTTPGKQVEVVLSATSTTAGVVNVYIFGYRGSP